MRDPEPVHQFRTPHYSRQLEHKLEIEEPRRSTVQHLSSSRAPVVVPFRRCGRRTPPLLGLLRLVIHVVHVYTVLHHIGSL